MNRVGGRYNRALLPAAAEEERGPDAPEGEFSFLLKPTHVLYYRIVDLPEGISGASAPPITERAGRSVYEFRVWAYGDGTGHAATWGQPRQ